MKKARNHIAPDCALTLRVIALKNRKKVPVPFWRMKAQTLWRAIFPRVKLFYDWGVRSLQLVHFRINELGDIPD